MAKRKINKTPSLKPAVISAVLIFIVSFSLMYKAPEIKPAVRGINTVETNDDSLNKAIKGLEDLKVSLNETGNRFNEVNQKQLELTRNDLREGYQNSNKLAKNSWQKIDSQLEEVEKTLKSGSGDLIAVIDETLKSLNVTLRENKGRNI